MLPDALFGRLTPRQFLALFGKRPGDRGTAFDRVEAVRQSNDERGRRGEKPIIPSWL